MESLLLFFIIIPLFGYLISLVAPPKNEKTISFIAAATVGLQLILGIGFTVYWIFHDHPFINHRDLVIFKTDHYEFFIDLLFDKITAVYMLVGAFLTFLVAVYSKYYMHREEGYRRFFSTILFFFMGYNLVIFSGNLETMFIGWEILGISSFLLIAFYRDRYLPVKNALKVFSIYRIADVGLLVAMWMSHHLWHENITFVTLFNQELVNEHIQTHSWIGVIISLMLLLAAAAKSAQLPFSSWLPRAMEGPTPSSAIFYGSLSVHIGVFLLLRTFPFWEHQTSVRILFGIVGLATAIVTTGIARVQSSVKSQIAYSSIAQIGIIFIEVALGFDNLALIHFAGNAFLRTYQLLVSPSVVSYLIREQFYTFQKKKSTVETTWTKRFEYTYYMLCLKEWNLDSGLYRYFWNPLKTIGKKLNFLNVRRVLYFVIPFMITGGFFLYHQESLPHAVLHLLPIVFSSIGLIFVVKSFSERKDVYLSWMLVILNHFCIAIAVSFNEHYGIIENILYLSGIVVGGFVGYYALRTMQRLEGQVDLQQFHGHSYKHPKTAFVFLMCCLGMTGFPISPTFIGEDLVFSHIHEDQYMLAAITSLGLIIDGLSAIRIYARIFLGPHAKSVYDMAYRNG